jgi:hypothetical protein
MLKKTYLVYLIFLLIFIVFGFSLLAVDIDPSVFGIFFFSGYFILGLAFGAVFRKRFLSGLVIAFSTTFLSWLVAFVLFWSFRGIAALVQVFSEGYQNVLVAGLVFSVVTSAAVLLIFMVFWLVGFVSNRIRTWRSAQP